jgi:hypothetical protein
MHADHADVERLRERIGELVHERQELRTAGADRWSLEQNRRQLVDSHSELGQALIQQHAAALAT